jgi:hypothetical protein
VNAIGDRETEKASSESGAAYWVIVGSEGNGP